MNQENESTQRTGLEIAVIGMAGRFPGARNIEELWSNLEKGVESVTFFSEEELEAAGVTAAEYRAPGYVNAKGVMPGSECFDAGFFDYTPLEADTMDPQFRALHQCSYEALENAGYGSPEDRGPVGFYAGAAISFFWLARALTGASGLGSQEIDAVSVNDINFLATRISYKLDLKGPSFTVQTACSTSLTAIHLACQGLLSGECVIALAGGVSVKLPEKRGYLYQEGMILSDDGHCRPFDHRARGTNSGDGVAVVVLKRLDDAIDDRDTILAVVKGSSINNDGLQKVGFTAPSVSGQSAVIRDALGIAGVDPESISFIEAHGTGTPMGDPIEIEALTRAFETEKKSFCAIGSIKSNLGHLDTAAGAASFIKAVLALHHRVLPPSINFSAPNPTITFLDTPFYVNTRALPLEPGNGNGPLRGGVSAFGLGGTNVHAVLEEWPSAARVPADNREKTSQEDYPLLLLSAKTQPALERVSDNLSQYLRETPGVHPADAAYTLQAGREFFPYRRFMAGGTPGEPAVVREALCETHGNPVVFVFPAAVDAGWGSRLYREAPLFKKEVDLLPGNPGQLPEDPHQGAFVAGYALARLFMNLGVTPRAMVGEGAGHYAAACIAGVISPERALAALAGNESIAAEPKEPGVPFASIRTGKRFTAEEAADPNYWRAPAEMTHAPGGPLDPWFRHRKDVLLALGPVEGLGPVLKPLVDPGQNTAALHMPPPPAENISPRLHLPVTAGDLWLRGVTVDWERFHALSGEKPCRIPLPTYPFEQKVFDISVPTGISAGGGLVMAPSQAMAGQTAVPAAGEGNQPVEDTAGRVDLIFRETLGLEQLNRRDDFFKIGGDSLKAITVLSRVHKELDAVVPLQDMFARPSVVELADFIDGSARAEYQSIEQVEKKEYYPVSSAQRRLYFIQRMDPANKSYNIPVPLLVEGDIQLDRVQDAYRALIRRHESFRTGFLMLEGEPVQRIADEVDFDINYYEAEEGSPRCREILDTFDCQFDLQRPPLLKVGLVKTGPRRYILVHNFHHIIFDGFSLGIFIQEFMAVYQDEELPPLTTQYKEYAQWQASPARREVLEKQEEYWLREFPGKPPLLDLPIDYPRPGVFNFDGARYDFSIGPEETSAINALAFREGATSYMVLLAIYNILLSRLTGQQDIVIGSSAACRTHDNLLQVVGMFVNTLPMRNFPAGEKTFLNFLREVRVRTLAAFDNQDFQLEELVDKVVHSRDPGRNPLFDVMFVLNTEDMPDAGTQELKLSHYDYEDLSAQMDLKLRGWERGGEFFFRLEYATGLYKKETIEMYVANLKEVVTAVLENNEILLESITISHGLMSSGSNLLEEEQGDFVF